MSIFLQVWLHLPHHRLPLQSGRFQPLLPRPQLHHQYDQMHPHTKNAWFCKISVLFCPLLINIVPFLHFSLSPHAPVPCCPQDVTINLVSTETLEIIWSPVKGAELYETTAAQTNDIIHCNDTAPVCALSDLTCNTAYSVTVTPCSDLRGCNRTCTRNTHETGSK